MNSVDEQMKKRFVAASFEGVRAIFVERPDLVYVNVTDVIADDWGVKCTITDLSAPGMHKLRRSPCPIASSWEVLDFSDGVWHARYIPWRVFFDPHVINQFLAQAKEKAEAGEVIGWDDGHKISTEYYHRIGEDIEKRANALLRAREAPPRPRPAKWGSRRVEWARTLCGDFGTPSRCLVTRYASGIFHHAVES
jgi:hypothetical protein